MGIEASNVGQQSEKEFWREATLQVLTTIFRKQAANAELRKQLFEANVNAARDENHMQVACVCASAGSCVRVPASHLYAAQPNASVCTHARPCTPHSTPARTHTALRAQMNPPWGDTARVTRNCRGRACQCIISWLRRKMN